MSGPKTDLKEALQRSGGQVAASDAEVQENAEGAVNRQQSPSRIGKKAVTVYLERDAHVQLKILSAETDRSLQALCLEAMNLLFASNGKPPIAS